MCSTALRLSCDVLCLLIELFYVGLRCVVIGSCLVCVVFGLVCLVRVLLYVVVCVALLSMLLFGCVALLLFRVGSWLPCAVLRYVVFALCCIVLRVYLVCVVCVVLC